MSLNELQMRRGAMMQMRGGGGTDWRAMYVGTMNNTATEIVIPSDVVTIINSAFIGCTNLESVEIEEGLTRIGEAAFANCTKLKSITLPSTINNIGWHAFQAIAFDEFICLATTPPTISNAAFTVAPTVIYVPDASVNTYKAATNWSTYASIIKGISERP